MDRVRCAREWAEYCRLGGAPDEEARDLTLEDLVRVGVGVGVSVSVSVSVSVRVRVGVWGLGLGLDPALEYPIDARLPLVPLLGVAHRVLDVVRPFHLAVTG